jgi:hypothetical protein
MKVIESKNLARTITDTWEISRVTMSLEEYFKLKKTYGNFRNTAL